MKLSPLEIESMLSEIDDLLADCSEQVIHTTKGEK
jgi:hypothetical protein